MCVNVSKIVVQFPLKEVAVWGQGWCSGRESAMWKRLMGKGCGLGSVVTTEITRGECCTALQHLQFPQHWPRATIQVYLPEEDTKVTACISFDSRNIFLRVRQGFVMSRSISRRIAISTSVAVLKPSVKRQWGVWQVKKKEIQTRDVWRMSQSWQYLFHFLVLPLFSSCKWNHESLWSLTGSWLLFPCLLSVAGRNHDSAGGKGVSITSFSFW